MIEALIGLAGIVVGAVLGGTGKYFALRRDAWIKARTSGLLLLAEVRAVNSAYAPGNGQPDLQPVVACWKSQRSVLAGFRRGTYPNGLSASDWLELAADFAQLERMTHTSGSKRHDGWSSAAKGHLGNVERLLRPFENDPRVLWYVIRTSLRLPPAS